MSLLSLIVFYVVEFFAFFTAGFIYYYDPDARRGTVLADQ